MASFVLGKAARRYHPEYNAADSARGRKLWRSKTHEQLTLYKQTTVEYPVPISAKVLEANRMGEATSLQVSREYLRGVCSVGGREFVFDDAAYTCTLEVHTSTRESVMRAYYETATLEVSGLQRKCSYEYEGCPLPDDRDPIAGYFRDEVTPRFLNGEFTIDESFRHALHYACAQEREYRQLLALCG
ncbi:MAG TPA: hypothetical protein VLA92_03115 [Candidatus Saccharimonadales bacterium]|nr:hypothetical protein [Candidatus Saccharimonadales bacterium]